MPTILAPWEVEIKRIAVQRQLRQIHCKTLSGKDPTKRAGWVAQAVECLPSKHEAMTANPSTTKKKKKFPFCPQASLVIVLVRVSFFFFFKSSNSLHYVQDYFSEYGTLVGQLFQFFFRILFYSS
jgi:hypothetical protein